MALHIPSLVWLSSHSQVLLPTLLVEDPSWSCLSLFCPRERFVWRSPKYEHANRRTEYFVCFSNFEISTHTKPLQLYQELEQAELLICPKSSRPILSAWNFYQGFIGLTWSFASGIGPPIVYCSVLLLFTLALEGGSLAHKTSWRWIFYLSPSLSRKLLAFTLS